MSMVRSQYIYNILFFTDFSSPKKIIRRHSSSSLSKNFSPSLISTVIKLVLYNITKSGVKHVLIMSEGRSVGFAGHSNWMMTRKTLPHPTPVPKTKTPQNGVSLGRCNFTNMTSKGPSSLALFYVIMPLCSLRQAKSAQCFRLYTPKRCQNSIMT
jgi:hypothetical protein